MAPPASESSPFCTTRSDRNTAVLEAVAGGAGARRIIEGEQPWLQLPHAVTAQRAGEVGGKQHLFSPGSSISATTALPPESTVVVSNDSARRWAISAFTRKRSTTTSILCFSAAPASADRKDRIPRRRSGHGCNPVPPGSPASCCAPFAILYDRGQQHQAFSSG